MALTHVHGVSDAFGTFSEVLKMLATAHDTKKEASGRTGASGTRKMAMKASSCQKDRPIHTKMEPVWRPFELQHLALSLRNRCQTKSSIAEAFKPWPGWEDWDWEGAIDVELTPHGQVNATLGRPRGLKNGLV